MSTSCSTARATRAPGREPDRDRGPAAGDLSRHPELANARRPAAAQPSTGPPGSTSARPSSAHRRPSLNRPPAPPSPPTVRAGQRRPHRVRTVRGPVVPRRRVRPAAPTRTAARVWNRSCEASCPRLLPPAPDADPAAEAGEATRGPGPSEPVRAHGGPPTAARPRSGQGCRAALEDGGGDGGHLRDLRGPSVWAARPPRSPGPRQGSCRGGTEGEPGRLPVVRSRTPADARTSQGLRDGSCRAPVRAAASIAHAPRLAQDGWRRGRQEPGAGDRGDGAATGAVRPRVAPPPPAW